MHRLRFITVMGFSEGKPVLLSVDHIVAVNERDGGEGSLVLLSTAQVLEVQELPDQIMYMVTGH